MERATKLEESLSEALRASARATPISEDFVRHTVRLGRRYRIRRRYGVTGLTAAGVVALLVGTPMIRSLVQQDDDRPAAAIPPSSETSSHSSTTSLFDWASSLPQGAPPRLAYMAGTRLITTEQSVSLGATDAALVGALSAGYLVRMEFEELNPYSFSSALAEVSVDGSVVELPAQAGDVQDEVTSPDGSLYAYGHQVFRSSDNTVVANVPEGATVLEDWTDAGIIYSDSDGSENVWRPGSGTVSPLTDSVGSQLTHSGVTFTEDNGCTVVKQLASSGQVTQLLRKCGAGRPLQLSETGGQLLTSTAAVLDVQTGNIRDFGPGGPPAELGGTVPVAWEDSDSVLLSIQGRASNTDDLGTAGVRPTIIVRCSLAQQTCERAGKRLTLKVSDQLQFE